MSILMFSGMRKQIMSFETTGIAVKLRLALFCLIVFVSVLIMLGWFPYGDI